jgi:hypothetical protein
MSVRTVVRTVSSLVPSSNLAPRLRANQHNTLFRSTCERRAQAHHVQHSVILLRSHDQHPTRRVALQPGPRRKSLQL